MEGEKVLKAAFAGGALLDAGSVISMLFGELSRVTWGLGGKEAGYDYSQRIGASLMAGWTALLVWAYRNPLERRAAALLTVQVVLGFMLAEVSMVIRGDLGLSRALPLLIWQALIIAVFSFAYLLSREGTTRV